ncbi:UNVERIFIED_CONTAM: hypothetical protein HDU68_000921, partial [Siphonaria sp. JEL0065]
MKVMCIVFDLSVSLGCPTLFVTPPFTPTADEATAVPQVHHVIALKTDDLSEDFLVKKQDDMDNEDSDFDAHDEIRRGVSVWQQNTSPGTEGISFTCTFDDIAPKDCNWNMHDGWERQDGFTFH